MDGRRRSKTKHARGPEKIEGNVIQELTGIYDFDRLLHTWRFKKDEFSIMGIR
jgi:hypothetical protein